MEVVKAAIKVVNGVEVPRSDERGYRTLVLKNGLKVILCSDPTTDMAGAALEVSVGHFSDPDNVAGIAHFLEHMLFLGTETYPDENSYSAFLNENGGYSNAYTASEETQYQLEVARGALKGALDRFATFFTCPLFTASATNRELEAVDSEHSKNLQSDMWRLYQLEKATSNPAYPYSKFGTGNSVTLRDEPSAAGVDVRSALLAFHNAHYSAGRMTLAVLGAEDLDTLEAWVTPLFEVVTNNGSVPPVFSPGGEHPFDGAKSLLQHVVPIKDNRQLCVSWALPSVVDDWRSKPYKYVGNLLGHEGPGSLLSTLRERGWATGLSGGMSSTESGFSILTVTAELSPAGLSEWESVHDLIYAYIGMLRAEGPQEWLHDEAAAIRATSFMYKSKVGPFSTVTNLARNLALYPSDKVLTGPSLIWEWDAQGVSRLLDLLTPENSRVQLVAKDAVVASKANETEKWYKVQYSAEPLGEARVARLHAAAVAYGSLTAARRAANGGKPCVGGPAALIAGVDDAAMGVRERLGAGTSSPADLAGWDAASMPAALAALYPPLTLPAPNVFIATDVTLRSVEARETAARRDAGQKGGEEGGGEAAPPGSKVLHGVRVRREDTPTLVRMDGQHEVWLHTDSTFAVPKAYATVIVDLPAAYVAPRSTALCDLTVALAREDLTEVAYTANLAGLGYSIDASVHGISFVLSGFNHKLANLMGRVAAAVPRMATAQGFTDVAFAVQLDNLVRTYQNATKNAPYGHAMSNANVALTLPRWSTSEKLGAVTASPITPAELRAFVQTALSSSRFRMVVAGNAEEKEALALADSVSTALLSGSTSLSTPAAASTLTLPRVVALPQAILVKGEDGAVLTLAPELVLTREAPNPDEPNAAVEVYCQVGPSSIGPACEQTALIELIGHIISEPFFDSLRTRQALGYIVFARPKHELGVSGLRFLVQSNRVERAEELMDRTHAFLAAFEDSLAAMPADVFAGHVKACAVKSSEADQNFQELGSRLANEVFTNTLDFHRASHDVAALFALTQERVVEWYRAWVAPGGAKRRVFASLVERGGKAEPVSAGPPAPAPAAGGDEAATPSVTASQQPDTVPETLAGGVGQPGGGVKVEDRNAPSLRGLPVPHVRVPFDAFAGVLHVLHTHQHGGAYVPGAPADKALVLTALRDMCPPSVCAEVEGLLATPSPEGAAGAFVRLLVDVGSSQAHAVRTSLPLFHDAGSVARAVRIQAHLAR